MKSPDSSDTNPLPKVSSARSWAALSFPKVAPVIRERIAAPAPSLRVRADGTQEICADDILVIVPKPEPVPEALDADDLIVEEAEPEFRKPAYSIHATQEILADDVLEVTTAAVARAAEDVSEHRDEIPSTVPWTLDAPDDLEFPTPPKYSGAYPAISTLRGSSFSATQILRRRRLNVKLVVASVGLAAGLVLVSGVARLARGSLTEGSAATGPVGIALGAPQALDTTVRPVTLLYGTAPRLPETVAVSIDTLPSGRRAHARR